MTMQTAIVPPASESPVAQRTPALLRRSVWALVAAWAVSSLWYPFGWDQGIFAWVGAAILEGAVPYRDAFDIKGPVAHLVYALAQAAFGRNLWSIRLLDLAALGAVAWLMARLVDRLAGRGSGSWAAALLVLWYAGLTFWHTAQPDSFASWLLALGFMPLLARESAPSWRAMLACGVCIGLAIGIKPTYAAFILVPITLTVGRAAGRPRHMAPGLAAVAAGPLAVVGAIVAWFLAVGAFDDLWEVFIVYNATTYSSANSLAIEARLRGTFDYVLTGNVFVVLLPAVVLGLFRLWARRPVDAIALAVWTAVSFGTVVIQNKFFDYQWAPLLPPVVILGVVGLSAVVDQSDGPARGSGPGRQLGVLLGLVVLLHACLHPAFEVLNWATYVTGLRDRVSYYDTFGVPGNDLRMSRHIESLAQEGDRLVVMAWNIEILYMTGLETVSRFGYSLPLWMGEGSEFRDLYRSEYMDDLREHPPDFIVVGAQAQPLLGRPVSLNEFPEFHDFLQAHYHSDRSFGDLTLFRLRVPGS